jgi:hypothetical protein
MYSRLIFRSLAPRVAAISLLMGCGDVEAGQEKLDLLETGIAADSLFRLLGDGPMVASSSADSIKLFHGYRVSREYANGKSYAILFLRDQPGNVAEPLDRTLETPVVLDERLTVLGWGWSFYDSEGSGQFGKAQPAP